MTLDQDIPLSVIDALLERLHATADTVSQNLTELDGDSSLVLLSTLPLSGLTHTRWTEAKAAYDKLWPWYFALSDVLSQADTLRDQRRLSREERNEIYALLTTDPVELKSEVVPLAKRSLLASRDAVVRCTPDELLSEMDHTFAQVRTLLADVEAKSSPRSQVDAASARLAGLPATAALSSLKDQTTSLSQAAYSDPLSLDESSVTRLLSSLKDLETQAQRIQDLALALPEALQRATRLLDSLDTIAKAFASQEAEAKEKIAPAFLTPASPPAFLPLVAELASIRALASAQQSHLAASRLDAWLKSAAALEDRFTSEIEKVSAPLKQREELRGLLGAYLAKAAALGASEDPELTRLSQEAKDALYEAPCDLALAKKALTAYSQALALR